MQKLGALGLVWLLACGGSPAPSPKPLENTTAATTTATSRDQVVNQAILAITAGDVEKLMQLADPKGLFEYAMSCKADSGDQDGGAKQVATKLRADFTKSITSSRGTKVEVLAIKNEMRGWTGRRTSRYSTNDRNATFISKGGMVAKSCVARTDLLFHEVEVKVRLAKGSDSREIKVRLDLVQGGGRWFLVKVPADLGEITGAAAVMAKMEAFSKQMCDCKDKACADKVNEDMTKWGTELAKNASYDSDERPDPDVARRTADIMTLYTECMTKLMMAGAGGNP